LKYYNKQIHEASFVLPTFADEILNKQWQFYRIDLQKKLKRVNHK
jgi:hypothetical protein